jgi:hypothetical protein
VKYNEDLFHSLVFIPLCKSEFSIGTLILFREVLRVYVCDLVLHHETLGTVIDIKCEYDSLAALKLIVDLQYCDVFKEVKSHFKKKKGI